MKNVSTHLPRRSRPAPPNTAAGQRGIALFIALIALVVMTLGALTLFRAVDSVTAVAGNIAFRESAIALSGRGVEAARTYLLASAPIVHKEAEGYYATWSMYGGDEDMLNFDWGKGIEVTGHGQAGFRLWYVIHRLCENTGNPVDASCIPCGSSLTQNSATGETTGLSGSGVVTPCYRITARALGPRRAESVIQVTAF